MKNYEKGSYRVSIQFFWLLFVKYDIFRIFIIIVIKMYMKICFWIKVKPIKQDQKCNKLHQDSTIVLLQINTHSKILLKYNLEHAQSVIFSEAITLLCYKFFIYFTFTGAFNWDRVKMWNNLFQRMLYRVKFMKYFHECKRLWYRYMIFFTKV